MTGKACIWMKRAVYQVYMHCMRRGVVAWTLLSVCVAMVVTSLDTYALTDCTLYETQGGEKVSK